MKKIICLLTTLLFMVSGLFAQESEFKPSGKPFMRIFTDFSADNLTGDVAPRFQIKRGYFGYVYTFSPEFSAKINIDVGNPGVGKLQHTTYIKNAEMTYKKGNISVNFGMISTKLFKVQEKNWNHRYALQTFSDAYKLGHSADLGVNVSYKLAKKVTVDAIILNGEGYKKEQADSTFKAGLGITFEPVEKVQLRGYYESMPGTANQNTLALFVGYVGAKLHIGLEYNKQWNYDRIDGQDFGGFSGYASYHFNKKVELFARYDNLSSNDKPWHVEKDGQLYMTGVEYTPVKGIKVAPNIRVWKPSEDASILSGFINVEIAI